MVWLIIPGLLCLLISWLLFAPLELELDTTVPVISVNWKGIGSLFIFYAADDWRMRVSILFFRRSWSLEQLMLSDKPKKTRKKRGSKKRTHGMSFKKLLGVLTSFQVKRWSLAIDTGDPSRNALLYPVNLLPGIQQHIHINFCGNNYLVLQARYSAWRMIYAFLKQ